MSVQITRVYQFCATLPDNDTSVLVTGDAEQNVEEIGVAGWHAAVSSSYAAVKSVSQLSNLWLLCLTAEWRSGNGVGRINEVTLRRARLVLGWVTVFGQAIHLSISPNHLGQLSLIPYARREMSTSQSAVTLCGWGVKAGMVHSTCG